MVDLALYVIFQPSVELQPPLSGSLLNDAVELTFCSAMINGHFPVVKLRMHSLLDLGFTVAQIHAKDMMQCSIGLEQIQMSII